MKDDQGWGQGPKPTKRLAWNELIENTKDIWSTDTTESLLIGNELELMKRNRNALTVREIRSIHRLMDLCFKEGIRRGISRGAGTATEAHQRHAHANAQPFGGGADDHERSTHAGAASGDRAGPPIHHHGKQV